MASATKSMRRFIAAIERAAPGARFEVGVAWHPFHKWRCYQKIGDAVLFVAPDIARGLVATFDKVSTLPEWRGPAESLAQCFAELKRAADDCDLKNRQRAVPEAAAHPLSERISG